MVELTLVRHGQANTGAQSEADYDKLSDLGRQQARWLGEYFDQTGHGFDHVISGTLNRQRDTAQEICEVIGGSTRQDARLNELDYFGLAESLLKTRGIPMPDDEISFSAHVPITLDAWQKQEISTPVESFTDFADRIAAMLDMAQSLGDRVLFVTSGGVITMVMRLLLELDARRAAHILLQIHNSSVHRLVLSGDELVLKSYNATPHLDRPDRWHARTYV